jgi:IclR family transcriptional regulator, mhp operon transcriptional activator
MVPAVATDTAHRPSERLRCRTNSRRGQTDPDRRSYPPVESVCRALDVLRAVNKLRIASVNGIFHETEIPKPTIVRMLETLMAEGYVARDNMCGGYRVTGRVHELHSGYEGISETIEVARPFAIDLTGQIKWPIGIGVFDHDAIAIQFWTGTISPVVHTNTVLGLRPDLVRSAMGRAYLAFCPAEQRERLLTTMRANPRYGFGEAEERRFRLVLDRVRQDGYAVRDPGSKPLRTTTLGVPIRDGDNVRALMSVTFFTTAVPLAEISQRVLVPLRSTTRRIEAALAALHGPIASASLQIEPSF